MKARTHKSVRRPRGSSNVYADLGYKVAALLGRDIDIVVRSTPKRRGQGAVSVSFA
jgi:hypothetical protein